VADDAETMGPISYLVVEFPGNRMTGEGFAALVDLVDRGLIRILDLRFVRVDADGSVQALELADLDADGKLDLMVFDGVQSGLLDDSDLADASGVLKAGASAGILLFENCWATRFVEGMRRGGGELVAAGYIPMDAVVASLDATDAG
jgi:Family of unknown function (DUF6325)